MRGVASHVSPLTGFRFVCYCKDCQAFARFLGRSDVLDPAGGTDILQMPPARLRLTAGMDRLRCLSLSKKVLRWYTRCCQTPLANSAASPRFPIIGVNHSFIDHEGGDRFLDDVLGPPLCRIFKRSAIGALPPNAPGRPSPGVVARRTSTMLGWWMRGLGRPNPFFDDETKLPRTTAHVLTPSEHSAVLMSLAGRPAPGTFARSQGP